MSSGPTVIVQGTGIDPTGATDSTAAINALIAALPTNTQDTLGVYFPDGVYKTTAPLVSVGQNILFFGNGPASAQIMLTGSTPYIGIDINAAGVVQQNWGCGIKNLGIIQQGNSTLGMVAARIRNSSTAWLQDLFITTSGGAFDIGDGTSFIKMHNIRGELYGGMPGIRHRGGGGTWSNLTIRKYSMYANSGPTIWSSGSQSIQGFVNSGTFQKWETITQNTTGATAILADSVPWTSTSLYVTAITGSPDSVHYWTGNTSGARFTPNFVIAGSVTSGTFTNGETVTQTSTGITAVVSGTVNANGPLVVISLSGNPDNNPLHYWVGGSSGAHFAPTSAPVVSPFSPNQNIVSSFMASNSELGGTGSSNIASVSAITSNSSSFTLTVPVNHGFQPNENVFLRIPQNSDCMYANSPHVCCTYGTGTGNAVDFKPSLAFDAFLSTIYWEAFW